MSDSNSASSQQPLAGRVALVTGASGGLGRATALALAEAGAEVALHYRSRREEAEALREQIEGLGRQAVTLCADVTIEAEVKAMVAQCAEALGGLDILVNNAGWSQLIHPNELDAITDEHIDGVMRLKVQAPLYAIRSARLWLERSGSGCVVNITSAAGIAGRGSSHVYAAANAALGALTKGWARTLAPQVRVNAVAPGYVDTGFVTEPGKQNPGVSRNNYLGRVVEAQEIAATVLFLASNGGITGEELLIDGGLVRLGKRG